MKKGFPVNFQILQTALWSAPTGILISDNNLPDNPIIYCNPQFTAVSGYPADEVIGKNCRFLQGEDTDRNEVRRVRAALTAGDAFQGDLLNYRKDGTPFWNQLTLSPIRNETDQITHFIGFQNDITRRVEAEKNLQSAFAAATKINANLSQFATNIAHDLKNPISTLAIAANALEISNSRGLPSDELLANIAESSRNITALIDEILHYTIEGSSEKKPVSLTEVTRAAMTHFPENAARRVAASSSLPVARCNRVQMIQVFQNLLGNAFKYGGADSLPIQIDSASTDKYWLIRVTDQGRGIPTALRETIFEPMTRGRADNLSMSSQGIGLATVKRIIEEHNGTVWVEDAPHGGASFCFTLPK